MKRIVASLLTIGLLGAPALAEVPPAKTPQPAAHAVSKPVQPKVALAKKRTTHHRRHKRQTHASTHAAAPNTK